MRHLNRKIFLVIMAMLALLLALNLAACSDSDDPAEPTEETPAGDTTAPILISTDPEPEATKVPVGETISAYFSEALDPDSLDGNITLSTGTITNLVLVGGNEVEIRHGNWDEGDQVTLTFTTGLADTAGNNLAEEISYRYFVESSTVTVLETTPANGATDVLRNIPVLIKFSTDMTMNSLTAGITATIPGKGDLSFSLRGIGNSTYAISFDDTIPEDTHVMFTISNTCQSWTGEFLAAEYSFSYDTGSDLDETTPEILSFEPAIGSEISPTSNTLQITFSEPINTDGLQFLRADLLSLLAMELAEVYGGWNPERTVLTVTFASPLPSGIEMTLDFGNFTDQSGNTNTSQTTWSANVSGTADHYPVSETLIYLYDILEHDGQGNYYDDNEERHLEWVDSTRFKNKVFDVELEVWNEWDNLIRTSNSIEFDGFREFIDGVGQDMDFNNPVKILNHPTVTATWSGNVEVTTPEGVMDIVFDGEVLPEVNDFPVLFGSKSSLLASSRFQGMANKVSVEMFWPNCRSVVQHIQASAGGELMFTETDTIVYCPGFGVIKEMGHEVQGDGDEFFTTTNLSGLNPYMD